MEDQNQSWMNICCELKERLEVNPDLFSESHHWCYGYNPEMKHQSSRWKYSMSLCHPKRASSEVQCEGYTGLCHQCKRNCPGRNYSCWSNYYLAILKCLWDKNLYNLWQSREWWFPHDNVPAYSFWLKMSWPTYPPLSFTQSCSLHHLCSHKW